VTSGPLVLAAIEERARSLVASRLGVRIELRREEAYRASAGATLEGEWVGAFLQPGVVLNPATAMRVHMGATTGQAVDEYGAATLSITARDGERVALTKDYAGQPDRQFRYVGALSGGVLAGYWHSLARPAFAGLFWLARTDRVTDSTAELLTRRVASFSWRRGVVKAAAILVTVGIAWGSLGPSAALYVAVSVNALAFAVYRLRATALHAEVERWRGLLGTIKPEAER
jgi:hypothetical protein